jgi:hypothetical protein
MYEYYFVQVANHAQEVYYSVLVRIETGVGLATPLPTDRRGAEASGFVPGGSTRTVDNGNVEAKKGLKKNKKKKEDEAWSGSTIAAGIACPFFELGAGTP